MGDCYCTSSAVEWYVPPTLSLHAKLHPADPWRPSLAQKRQEQGPGEVQYKYFSYSKCGKSDEGS